MSSSLTDCSRPLGLIKVLETSCALGFYLDLYILILASKLYPPRSNQDLRNLYQRIVTSTSPDHHKQSLVYYILKDLPSQPQSSVDYAKNSYIPNKYQVFIDGIWYLDRLVFEVSP